MAPSTSNWEELLSKATARGSNIVPGVVLAAITSSGKQLYSKAAGYNGLSPTAPPLTKDATFSIASCTKLLTSIAALQCVERGQITLDEPVEQWLPELHNKPIITLQNHKIIESQSKTKITLRHLLTHTSGFEYESTSPVLTAWRVKNPRDPNPAETMTKPYNTPLVFEPGKGWAYGTGLDWTGILIERLNDNITLDDYFHKHIFTPLGSHGENTTFRLRSPQAQQSRIAERLLPTADRQEDGTLAEPPSGTSSSNIWQDSGGEGLYCDVGDYMLVLQDIIAPEPKLLQKTNLEDWLFRGHVEDRGLLESLMALRTIITPGEDRSAEVGGFVNHSLGGMYCEQDGSVLPKGTLSWAGSPSLRWFANREKGVAAMFATQVKPLSDPVVQDLTSKYFQEVWRLYNESL